MNYLDTIKTAVVVFPFIAVLITIPFILKQYHRYGSISFLRAIIIYTFVLYLICAYFLIILPLPKISDVAVLDTARTQLIPFKFIFDFINESSFQITNFSTYIKAIKEPCFYVPLYNIFLTLPFGVYMRWYYKCNLKKTIFYSFLLSLFFELTQLSGLYFIYPRGYRLFDIDDLMLNSFGGLLGYFIISPFLNKLPKRDQIDKTAYEKGKNISGFRRTTTFCLDFVIVQVVYYFISLSINYHYLYILIFAIYYLILPIFFKGNTIGEIFLNIKLVDYSNNSNIIRMILRRVLFTFIYVFLPYLMTQLIDYIDNPVLKKEFCLIYLVIGFILLVVVVIKFVFTKNDMLYERLSKTKLVSTIKK